MYRRKVTSVVTGVLLTGAAAFAGSFVSDFSNPNQTGFTVNGGTTAAGNPYPAIENGQLVMTYNEASLQGAFVVDDLDGGAAIESFTAKFKMQLGPGTGTPADGVSFVFGPDINSGSVFNEEGPAMSAGVAVCFDTYDNGAPDHIGIDIKVAGNIIASTPLTGAQMVDSALHDVFIQVTRSGMFTLAWNNTVYYTNLVLTGWAPTQGQFAIGARTGGLSEAAYVDDLEIKTVVATADVAPTIKTQPQDVTVAEGASATFTVGFDGSAPFSFQWTKNGADIADATNSTLVLTAVPASDNNAKIACKVTNNAGTATSQAATLKVTSDTVAPTVAKVAADMTFTTVVVTYSEPVNDTALTAANYALDQSVSVSSATRVDPKTIKLTTSKMAEGGIYTLTINGVKDAAVVPNTIAANTKAEVRAFVYVPGMMVHQKYDNVPDANGDSPDKLFSDPRYPSAPNRADLLTVWEYPPNGAGRDAIADPVRNYFDTIEGFFIPPTTGDYVFFICGADRFWLYLSTDESPANMHLIAAIPGGWTQPRNWITGESTDLTPARSDSYDGTQWPDGNTIRLTAGKRYYMLNVHHDPSWCGADDFSATYKLASEADPANGDISRLSGNVVGYYLNPAGASVTFTQQPQSVAVEEGRTATFTAAATGSSAYGSSVSYQWQSAPKGSSTWTDIADATKAAYTTPPLAVADDGKQYRLKVNVPAYSASSDPATVSVTADTSAPAVVSAGAVKNPNGSFDVGVKFDEQVSETTAMNKANYTLSAGTIQTVTYFKNSPGVVLNVTGLTTGGKQTVTVKNVADPKGNAITTATAEFQVSNLAWGFVGGEEMGLGYGAGYGVLPVGANGFDVYSDGVGEWGSYDEATFVYEEITGDFDKKLRVEYQDNSSQWARAGLIARDVTNFGVDRAAQEGGAAGRYQKVHVNPVGPTLTGPGNNGNNAWESNRRLETGAGTTSIVGANGNPLYPNAWCRLQRVGQVFTVYRSDDGLNWTQLGSTDFATTAAPMPDKLFVGPEYSPETGNITQAADKGRFLARMRDYSDASVVGGYMNVLQPNDPIVPTSTNSPPGEQAPKVIDGLGNTKYLNFDKLNTGFTVTPQRGITTVKGIVLTSANDATERDPASFQILGSNDGTTYALIAEGTVPAFSARFWSQVFWFSNDAGYTSYKVVFPTVASAAAANSMQIAEVQLLGVVGGSAPANKPALAIAPAAGGLKITFEGTLQSCDSIGGAWSDVQGAVSPYNVAPGGAQKFYRAKR